MSVRFASASSTQLKVSSSSYPLPPCLAYPFTWAAWVRPTGTGTLRSFISCDDNSLGTVEGVRLGHTTTAWYLGIENAGSNTITVGTPVNNRWDFVIGRILSDTNRRIHVLQGDGSIVSGSSSVSKAIVTYVDFQIGCRGGRTGDSEFFAGDVACFAAFDADIHTDSSAAMPDDLIRRLAFQGPFANEEWKSKLSEMWTFFGGHKNITNRTVYFRQRVPYLWSESATAPTMGEDPPDQVKWTHP